MSIRASILALGFVSIFFAAYLLKKAEQGLEQYTPPKRFVAQSVLFSEAQPEPVPPIETIPFVSKEEDLENRVTLLWDSNMPEVWAELFASRHLFNNGNLEAISSCGSRYGYWKGFTIKLPCYAGSVSTLLYTESYGVLAGSSAHTAAFTLTSERGDVTKASVTFQQIYNNNSVLILELDGKTSKFCLDEATKFFLNTQRAAFDPMFSLFSTIKPINP